MTAREAVATAGVGAEKAAEAAGAVAAGTAVAGVGWGRLRGVYASLRGI